MNKGDKVGAVEKAVNTYGRIMSLLAILGALAVRPVTMLPAHGFGVSDEFGQDGFASCRFELATPHTELCASPLSAIERVVRRSDAGGEPHSSQGSCAVCLEVAADLLYCVQGVLIYLGGLGSLQKRSNDGATTGAGYSETFQSSLQVGACASHAPLATVA
jgi:hypothetical protein